MGDDISWLIIGVLVGISLGYILSQIIGKHPQASIVFDRDQQGRITGIHYVPGGV
jgi:F0F1-type ATP synthase assembly protein I